MAQEGLPNGGIPGGVECREEQNVLAACPRSHSEVVVELWVKPSYLDFQSHTDGGSASCLVTLGLPAPFLSCVSDCDPAWVCRGCDVSLNHPPALPEPLRKNSSIEEAWSINITQMPRAITFPSITKLIVPSRACLHSDSFIFPGLSAWNQGLTDARMKHKRYMTGRGPVPFFLNYRPLLHELARGPALYTSVMFSDWEPCWAEPDGKHSRSHDEAHCDAVSIERKQRGSGTQIPSLHPLFISSHLSPS